jgi:acetyl-CoA C-acetyltransferase
LGRRPDRGHEAFAAQALAVNKDLAFDASKVNRQWQAIAIGHPIEPPVRISSRPTDAARRQEGSRMPRIGGGMGTPCAERD